MTVAERQAEQRVAEAEARELELSPSDTKRFVQASIACTSMEERRVTDHKAYRKAMATIERLRAKKAKAAPELSRTVVTPSGYVACSDCLESIRRNLNAVEADIEARKPLIENVRRLAYGPCPVSAQMVQMRDESIDCALVIEKRAAKRGDDITAGLARTILASYPAEKAQRLHILIGKDACSEVARLLGCSYVPGHLRAFDAGELSRAHALYVRQLVAERGITVRSSIAKRSAA